MDTSATANEDVVTNDVAENANNDASTPVNAGAVLNTRNKACSAQDPCGECVGVSGSCCFALLKQHPPSCVLQEIDFFTRIATEMMNVQVTSR